MKCKTSIFSLFSIVAATLFSGVATGQNIEKPTIGGKTSFAVIVDQATLTKCRTEIDNYKNIVESEGLPTYIISDNWSSPEEIRGILKDLYTKNNLEGAFLIGDIPVAMVADNGKDSSNSAFVPTDRFYDDFDLEFDIVKDSLIGFEFCYHLSPASEKYIECDIYTSRLKPLAKNGCKYEQISKYLRKAIEAHKEHNHFDSFVSYTGFGSYSECLKAWREEQQILHEQYPGVFTQYNNAKFIRFSMDIYPKDYVIRELRRPDLDFMVIHSKGLCDRQNLAQIPDHMEMEQFEYIKYDLRTELRKENDDITGKVLALAEKWGLDSTWYTGYNTPQMIRKDSLEEARGYISLDDIEAIAPNTRLIIMDCDFNGDFSKDNFIAGGYIMTDGKCVAAMASSKDVQQDISVLNTLGLLGQGMRLGNWAKYRNTLDSHIFGDPTFHYHAPHHSANINEMDAIKEVGFWVENLNHQNPAVQNISLIKLVGANHKGIEDILLNKVLESPNASVRYNSLMLLEKLEHPNWYNALISAANDGFEFIRQTVVSKMGICNHTEFIPLLIDSYVNDYYALRVRDNIVKALKCFNRNLVLEEIEKYFAENNSYLAPKFKKELVEFVTVD